MPQSSTMSTSSRIHHSLPFQFLHDFTYKALPLAFCLFFIIFITILIVYFFGMHKAPSNKILFGSVIAFVSLSVVAVVAKTILYCRKISSRVFDEEARPISKRRPSNGRSRHRKLRKSFDEAGRSFRRKELREDERRSSSSSRPMDDHSPLAGQTGAEEAVRDVSGRQVQANLSEEVLDRSSIPQGEQRRDNLRQRISTLDATIIEIQKSLERLHERSDRDRRRTEHMFENINRQLRVHAPRQSSGYVSYPPAKASGGSLHSVGRNKYEYLNGWIDNNQGHQQSPTGTTTHTPNASTPRSLSAVPTSRHTSRDDSLPRHPLPSELSAGSDDTKNPISQTSGVRRKKYVIQPSARPPPDRVTLAAVREKDRNVQVQYVTVPENDEVFRAINIPFKNPFEDKENWDPAPVSFDGSKGSALVNPFIQRCSSISDVSGVSPLHEPLKMTPDTDQISASSLDDADKFVEEPFENPIPRHPEAFPQKPHFVQRDSSFKSRKGILVRPVELKPAVLNGKDSRREIRRRMGDNNLRGKSTNTSILDISGWDRSGENLASEFKEVKHKKSVKKKKRVPGSRAIQPSSRNRPKDQIGIELSGWKSSNLHSKSSSDF